MIKTDVMNVKSVAEYLNLVKHLVVTRRFITLNVIRFGYVWLVDFNRVT